MKKITIFSLSIFFLLSGMFLWKADAHRIISNGVHQIRQARTFSNRHGSFKYKKPTRRQLQYQTVKFTHPSMRANTALHQPYREPALNYKDQKMLRRIQSPELYPRYMNELQSQVHVVRNDNYSEVKGMPFTAQKEVYLYTGSQNGIQRVSLVNDDRYKQALRKYNNRFPKNIQYRIQPDKNFSLKDGVYRNKKTSFAFRVKTDDSNTCTRNNMESCAVSARNAFVDGQNLSITSSVKRIALDHQGLVGSFQSIPSVTEVFYASAYDKEYIYYLFTVLNPEDGAVVRIEGVSDLFDRDESVIFLKQIIQSFQFI